MTVNPTGVANKKARRRDWGERGNPRRMRSFKVEDPLWEAVQAEAARRGITTSELVRDVLRAEVQSWRS